MKEEKKKKIGLVAVFIIAALLFTTGVIEFVTIANIEDISGDISVSATNADTDLYETWTWDIKESVSPAFDSSSVKGTLFFEINVVTGDVAAIRLEVDGISEGSSPLGNFWFTSDGLGCWTLHYNTLLLLDGEYVFTIYGTPSAAEGSDDDSYDVPFSSFGFLFEDGVGDSVFVDDYTLILVAIIVSIFVMITVRKFRK